MSDAKDDHGAPEPVLEGDSSPEAAAESDPGAPMPAAAATRTPSVAGRVVQWLLPIVLAGGAMGVHWTLNVPDEIQHSPKDQGAKDKGKAAKKPGKRERFTARDQSRLDREWRRYSQDELASEPVRTAWARKYQAVVSKAVVVARRHAFEKAPEEPRVIVTATECHTVRCSFILRSPFEHELQLLDASLERIVDHNGTIWRTYTSRSVPPPADSPKDQHNLEVVVAFASDMVDSRGFEVGPAFEDGQGPRAAADSEPAEGESGAPARKPAPAAEPKAQGADERDDDENDEGGQGDEADTPDDPEEIRGGGDEDPD
jgi:hypothetical protein